MYIAGKGPTAAFWRATRAGMLTTTLFFLFDFARLEPRVLLVLRPDFDRFLLAMLSSQRRLIGRAFFYTKGLAHFLTGGG
jgi:hypothetical protein